MEKSNYKISVIVAVYNAEDYLCNCCNSILAQTYRNIELILVNDGSEDNSLAICKEIQASDKRVVVIDKENGGCYSAWNKGLDVATGDLIGFVDNDDYIQPQMYETLLDILIEQDADICACNRYRNVDNINDYCNMDLTNERICVFSGYDAVVHLLSDTQYREDLVLLLGDVTEKISARQKVDYIFHCASVTASKVMINNPVETLLTSIDGTKNVLNFARESSCKSVVYVSSMEMYGSFAEANNNVTETELGYINPLAVRSNYPESKRLCENMCVAFWSEYGVPVKIARLSQTFGAGILSGENRVFAQFARSAIEGKDIVLHTRGLSEGNYCYTRDTIMGLFLILIKGENAEAYNVTNPETHTTIVDMARMVCQKFGNGKIKVVFDIPESNQFGYAADTKMKLNADKLKNLGWRPEIGLEEAYRRMIMGMKREG